MGHVAEPEVLVEGGILGCWDQYVAMKLAIDELHEKSLAPPGTQAKRIAFETEVLEPMLVTLDDLARQISDAPTACLRDVEIKARVVRDYLGDDPSQFDVSQSMALALCNAVLALSSAEYAQQT